MLDKDAMDELTSTLDNILSYNKSVYSKLDNMMSACGGLVNFGNCQERLDDAYNKINRFQSLKSELEKYKIDVLSLDANLVYEYGIIYQNYPEDILLSEYIISSDANISQEMKELIRTMLVRDANGIYGFEEYLLKDPEALTDMEVQALAIIYQTACDKVELASDSTDYNNEIGIVEHFAANLFTLEKGIEYLDMGVEMPHMYIVANGPLIEKLAMNMSDSKANSLAYSSLNAIYNVQQFDVPIGWFEHGFSDNIDDIEELYKTKLTNMNITLTNVGMNMKIMYCPNASRRGKCIESNTLYATGMQRAQRYVESLPPSVISRMEGLGYQKEDIAKQFIMAESETDEKFWDGIVKKDYLNAFIIPSDELSHAMKSSLSLYAIQMDYYSNESNTKELCDFVNAILYQDETRCRDSIDLYYDPEEYIDVLLEYTALNRDVYYATLFEEEAVAKQKGASLIDVKLNKQINRSSQMDTVQIDKAKYCESLCNMYGFWYAFSNEMHYNYNFELLSRPGVFWGQGAWHHTIENLQKSPFFGSYSFTVNKVDSKDGSIYESTDYSTEYISSGSITDLEDTLSNINQLNERIDNLMNECAFETVLDVLYIYCPSIGNAGKLLDNMSDGSVSGTISKIGTQSINGHKFNNNTKCGISVLAALTKYEETKRKLEKQKSEEGKDFFRRWFYSCNVYTNETINHTFYIGDGIYDYDKIMAIKAWDREGIGIVLENEYASAEKIKNQLMQHALKAPTGLKKINAVDGRKNSSDLNGAILFLICGADTEKTMKDNKLSYTEYKSIIDIPSETLLDAVNYIEQFRQKSTNNGNQVMLDTYSQGDMFKDISIEDAWNMYSKKVEEKRQGIYEE